MFIDLYGMKTPYGDFQYCESLKHADSVAKVTGGKVIKCTHTPIMFRVLINDSVVLRVVDRLEQEMVKRIKAE